MVDVNQYYTNESDYLKASDLENGKKYPLTVKEVSVTEFDNNGKKENKLALSFQETEKKLTLNKTNAMVICSVHGPETDAWPGQKINVYRTMVQFGDKMVDAVRVDMPLVEASMTPRQESPAQAATSFQSPDGFDNEPPF